MRKHNLRCNYCGTDHYISYFFLMLRLLIKGRVYYVCSECGYTSNYILIKHIVHDTLCVNEKEFNRRLDKESRKLWRNG